MTIFEHLEQWLSENRTHFQTEGISVALTRCQPTDNTAAYFDIDTETVMARATVWQSKEIDFEAIQTATARKFISEIYQAKDIMELFLLLDDFFVRLRLL